MMNISFEFDEKAFEKAFKKEAKRAIAKSEFDYPCPECGANMKIKVGETRSCPSCGFNLTAEMD